MIPYAILCGKIYTDDRTSTEIRALELWTNGFSFRLPVDFLEIHGQFKRLVISFFDWKNKEYNTISISVTEGESYIIDRERTGYYIIYEFNTDRADFVKLSQGVSRDYLKYIDCRLELNDAEMSREMADYPAKLEDVFEDTYPAARHSIAERIMSDADNLQGWEGLAASSDTEICISLENIELVGRYLDMPVDEFIAFLFGENELENHPLSKAKIRRIYIGNPYCRHQCPDVNTVLRVIDKAHSDNCAVTVVFPPVSAEDLDLMCKNDDSVIGYLEAQRKNIKNAFSLCDEISVNDWGMYKRLSESDTVIGLIKGVLLNKDRRDPRIEYVSDICCTASEEKKKADGQREKDYDREFYFPYYQTNTGTFCPLHAIINNGSRGRQQRVKECNRLCEHKVILYPKHLNMIGKYNSLFGYTGEPPINFRGRVVINL